MKHLALILLCVTSASLYCGDDSDKIFHLINQSEKNPDALVRLWKLLHQKPHLLEQHRLGLGSATSLGHAVHNLKLGAVYCLLHSCNANPTALTQHNQENVFHLLAERYPSKHFPQDTTCAIADSLFRALGDKKQALFNQKNRYGKTPVDKIIEYGNHPLLQKLIEAGLPLKGETKEENLLYKLVSHSSCFGSNPMHEEMVYLLLKAGSSAEENFGTAENPLYPLDIALQNHNTYPSYMLFLANAPLGTAGIEVLKKYKFYKKEEIHLFSFAIACKDMHQEPKLRGSTTKQRLAKMHGAITRAEKELQEIETGNRKNLQWLIAYGRKQTGNAPIPEATVGRIADSLFLALGDKKQALFNQKNRDGQTPVDKIIEYGNHPLLQKLIEAGLPLKGETKEENLLYKLVSHSSCFGSNPMHEEMVYSLLKAGSSAEKNFGTAEKPLYPLDIALQNHNTYASYMLLLANAPLGTVGIEVLKKYKFYKRKKNHLFPFAIACKDMHQEPRLRGSTTKQRLAKMHGAITRAEKELQEIETGNRKNLQWLIAYGRKQTGDAPKIGGPLATIQEE